MMAPEALRSLLPPARMQGGELCPVEGFPGTVCWALSVPGGQALSDWQHFRPHAGRTGFWPVIVGGYAGPEAGGSGATVELLAERAQDVRAVPEEARPFPGLRDTPAETLALALDCPLERWVERQRDPEFQASEHRRKADYFARLEGGAGLAALHRQWAEDWRGRPPWRFVAEEQTLPPRQNRNPPQHELHCLACYDPERQRSVVADSVLILFVPTPHSWQLPAFLAYSTREHERPPAVHVAALKWLRDRFRAELVGIDDRVLEVVPQSRPGTAVDASHAAAMLAAYSDCPVTSETESSSIPELADYLMESEYWSFCWP